MGGIWVGYLYVLVVCGGVIGLIGCCTAALYVAARFRRREPTVRVVELPARHE